MSEQKSQKGANLRHRLVRESINNQAASKNSRLGSVLRVEKVYLTAVIAWPDGEVQPYRTVAVSLDKEFVEILLALVSIVQ